MKKSFETTLTLDFGVLGMHDCLVQFYIKSEDGYLETKIEKLDVMVRNKPVDIKTIVPTAELAKLAIDLQDMYMNDFRDMSDHYRDLNH